MSVERKRYEWDTLNWREGRGGLIVSELKLHADEYLDIENGNNIVGPARVIISYRTGDTNSQVECLPLDSGDFDYDNPMEYPCQYCGATRGNPCVGDDPQCVWRVFTIGGIL